MTLSYSADSLEEGAALYAEQLTRRQPGERLELVMVVETLMDSQGGGERIDPWAAFKLPKLASRDP